MPQFELANFIPQLAWLTLFFAILYFGIVKLTLPKVGRVMEDRETRISGDLSTAEQAKADADRIEADYAAGIADAQGRARAAMTEAKARASRSAEARLAAANAEIGRKAEAAQASLSEARDKAMTSIQAIAADAAADIVERLTGARPDDAAATRAVASATGS